MSSDVSLSLLFLAAAESLAVRMQLREGEMRLREVEWGSLERLPPGGVGAVDGEVARLLTLRIRVPVGEGYK